MKVLYIAGSLHSLHYHTVAVHFFDQTIKTKIQYLHFTFSRGKIFAAIHGTNRKNMKTTEMTHWHDNYVKNDTLSQVMSTQAHTKQTLPA